MCAQQVKSKRVGGADSLTVQWAAEDILVDEATGSKLGALILCTIATTAGCSDFPRATDTASVAGFRFVNNCIALPFGEAFVCAPQALVVPMLCAPMAPGGGGAPGGGAPGQSPAAGANSDAALRGAGFVRESPPGGGGGSLLCVAI